MLVITKEKATQLNSQMKLKTGKNSIWDIEFEDGKPFIAAQQDFTQLMGEEKNLPLTLEGLKEEIKFLKDLANDNEKDGELKQSKDCLSIRKVYMNFVKELEGAK